MSNISANQIEPIATGSSDRDVYAALKAAGISGSLVTRVEHPDDLSVIE
jgi:hypothetical protein